MDTANGAIRDGQVFSVTVIFRKFLCNISSVVPARDAQLHLYKLSGQAMSTDKKTEMTCQISPIPSPIGSNCALSWVHEMLMRDGIRFASTPR